MVRARKLSEVVAALPAKERKAVKARTAELLAEEMSLQQLRKAMKKTQVSIARRLNLQQDGVSKIERRTDLLISTLSSYVDALGGELLLIAQFPDRPPVRVGSIGAIAEPGRASPARSRQGRKAA
jgi:hypothetical protein